MSAAPPKIDDWRALLDCVTIDTAYNGTVFKVRVTVEA